MDANSLLALVFVGLFVLCGSCLATVVFLVARLTGDEQVVVKPTRKIFARAPRGNSTPELVGAPKITTPVEPESASGVTHIDMEKRDEFLSIEDVPKSLLSEAVEAYQRGEGSGTDAITSVIGEEN